MSRFHSASFLLLFAVAGVLTAQQRPLINQRVDSSRVTRLGHTVHPLTRSGRDLGRAAADLPIERIQLHLSSSPEQHAALEQLLASQHDPASPHFQEWLTPEQFGERFGPAQQDIDAVVGWLQDNGFHVDEIGRGRRTLEFSGTASQVERAFHTQMRHYEVDGVRHLANATDLAIPEALAPVIGGLMSLHDFRHQPMHRVLGQDPAPATNLNGGAHGLSPYDFAAIYNVTPLWNTNFDGTGQSVAIAGRTNIKLTDVATFRSTFGLSANNPQVIFNGKDPGIVSSAEETEADLDVEWSGAVAKGAAIKFVVSASTNASDGVDLSDQYIVNNNVAPVMSVSFGACEASMGYGNAFYNSLWQQAAAQGISVFVAAGDSGSAGCDNPGSRAPASHGLAVSGLASTPYNAAVGGTQFTDITNPAAYWNTGNDSHYASAKSYIPETAWNESSYTTANAAGNNLYAGGGGASTLYATPSWQTGAGVPSQNHRYLPDVSLTAAGHDGYLVYQEGGLYLVGGTSVTAPSFAGLMAIVDQYTGGRNGNPNTRFYSLATGSPAVYHDIATGGIAVPCAGGSAGCSTAAPAGNVGKMNGYTAGAGYDLATGLGSVDAYAMALHWGARPPSGPPVVGSLTPNPLTGANANQIVTINGSGFVSGAALRVAVSYSGRPTTTLSGGQINFAGSTQIQALVNLGTTARIWTVQVVNPNGLASNHVNLQVVAPPPPPVVASLTPNPMTHSAAAQTLTINGSGFQTGSGLRVVLSSNGSQSMAAIQSASANQIHATINVGNAARNWTVQVVNPNGTASNTVTLTVK